MIELALALLLAELPALQLTTPKGDTIALYAEREPMCHGKLRATWFINSGKDKGRALRGCFEIRGADVRLEFEGGDAWVVPVSAFGVPRGA
jgi:hypothetical protein